MSQTAADLAQMTGGRVVGDPNRRLTGAAPFDVAGPNDVTFQQDVRDVSRLAATAAGCVFVTETCAERLPDGLTCSVVLVPDPQKSLWQVASLFRPALPSRPRSVSPQASVAATARIGTNCYVGPFAVIEDGAVVGNDCEIHAGVHIGRGCRIGNQTVLYPHAVLYDGVMLGDRVIIHAHGVIGADGFGYRFEGGRFEKIDQLGTVRIEDDVEIGCGTTVDRAALGETVIGTGTKIDNQVMVAHNCRIGKHNVFASQVGLAGSCVTENYVRLAGQAGIRDHVTLHEGVTVGAKGGVHCDIPAGQTWLGIPAGPEQEQKRVLLSLKRIPEIRDRLREVESQVQKLLVASANSPRAVNDPAA